MLYIGLLLISVCLSLGCISSDVPTGDTIYLDPSSPTFELPIRSLRSTVSWYLDERENILRVDEIPDKVETSYLLNYKDLPAGEHIFGAEDANGRKEWTIYIDKDESSATKTEVKEQTDSDEGGSAQRGYGRNTPREERHQKAIEYRNRMQQES